METVFCKSGDWLPRVEMGCLRVNQDAPCLLSASLGVVLSSELRAFEILTIRGFPCTNVASYSRADGSKVHNRHKATLAYCCKYSANSRCRKPGVGPGESSAPVALAWVELLWHAAFECGQQLVGLQRTSEEPSDLGNCLLPDTCS